MGDLGAEPRLVVPERLMIDESARERLERLLERSAPSVVGVAAEVSDLSPGASYRVHAEWRSLDGIDSAPAAATGPVRGAVLLRPDVSFAVRDGRVEVAGGSVLVDAGATVHDPYGEIGPSQDASERGRPPFPRRPMVVFLGTEIGADADRVRRLVNRLVRRDVEARIALPGAAGGLNLTRPCSPSEVSIRALAPDVVVTLDEGAAERVDAWCEGNRATVVVAYDSGLRDPMELVSWQIRRAQGRMRARIGPHVDVPAFAALVVRLCAGPQPIPPADAELAARAPVREHWTEAGAGERAGCVVLTGELDPATAQRVDGLVDNLSATRIPVERASVTRGVPAAARNAALVLLVGASGPDVDALVVQRREAGLPIAVDLGPSDLRATSDAEPGPSLTDAAAARAESCGLVIAPPGAVYSAARELNLRALALPTLLTRGDAVALRDARTSPDPAAQLVIGWRLPAPGAAAPEYLDAVAQGVAAILAKRNDTVELVGDAAGVPIALRGRDRVTNVAEAAYDPSGAAHWSVHVWTPALRAGQLADDTRQFEAVSYAGVASVMPAAACESVDGFVSSHVLVQSEDRAEEWVDALHHVLDDAGRRARRTEEALRRADAVDSSEAAKTVVTRFMGWACYRQPVRA